jgi:hypothetical protein
MQKDETYYENLDKRTKEYKDWKASFEESQQENVSGLGDSIEKFTEATGIKKVVEFIAGEDCGCDDRKEALNKLFPYSKPNCVTEEDYEILTNLFVERKSTNKLSADEVKTLYRIHDYVFNKKSIPGSCPSCIRSRVSELKRYFLNYSK